MRPSRGATCPPARSADTRKRGAGSSATRSGSRARSSSWSAIGGSAIWPRAPSGLIRACSRRSWARSATSSRRASSCDPRCCAVCSTEPSVERRSAGVRRAALLRGSRGRLRRGPGLVRRELRLEEWNLRLLERPADVIPDPLAIPPFDGRHRDPLDQHLVLQVIADGQAGRAGLSELLALLDLVPRLHGDARLVPVERPDST